VALPEGEFAGREALWQAFARCMTDAGPALPEHRSTVRPGFAGKWLAAREYRAEADNEHIGDGLLKAGLTPSAR
jgi:hypothetical protein